MKAFLRFLLVITIIAPTSGASLLWTNTAGGAWSEAANWSPNQTPSAADIVLITENGTYTVVMNVPATVISIVLGGESGNQTLEMAAPSLTVGAMTVRQNGIFERDGASQDRNIASSGGITVLGQFRLRPPLSAVTGPGGFAVAEGGHLEVLGDLELLNTVLVNGGTMIIGNGETILLKSNSSIRNLATGELNLTGDNSGIKYWADGGNLSPFVLNEGQFRSQNDVFIDVPVTMGGAIEVQNGTLDLRRNLSYPVASQSITAAITVNAGGVLSLRGWTFEFATPANINGSGTFHVGAGATVNLRNGVTYDAAVLEVIGSSTLNLETGSPIIINDGLLENGGRITGSDAITISGDFVSRGGGSFRGSGSVIIGPSAFVSLQRSTLEFARLSLVNNGEMSWLSSRVYLGNKTVFRNRGSINITNSPEEVSPTMIGPFNVYEDEALLNEGVITVADANATDVRLPIYNSGTVRVERNRLWFVLAGGYTQTAGRTELAGGNMEFGSARFSLLGGELTGSGSILGIGTLTNVSGTVSPGTSPGRINLAGRYHQQSGATLNIELGGTEPGTGFDQIVAGLGAGLAGTLNLALVNGFVPAPGAKFLIVSSPIRGGQFSAVNLPPGLDMRINYLSDGVEAELISVSLQISPNAVSLVPGETQTFSAASGSPPYTFSIIQNNSGGSINASTGSYVAGPNPGTDTIRVTDALNATAQATAQVLAPLQISPPAATRLPGQTESFTASGGSPPYTFGVTQNNSGGSINALSGFFTAGSIRGVTDLVRVTDSAGRFAQASVTIPNAEAVVRIFGRIRESGGAPVIGAEVLLSGGISRTAKTRDGTYSFDALPAGGSYTVSVFMSGQNFGPPKTFLNLSADQQADFTATDAPGKIRGIVTLPDGTPVAGVGIAASSTFSIGAPVVRSTATGADGSYEFRDLPLDRSYRVSGSGGFIFRPGSHTVSVAPAGATANFTVEPAHRISGQINMAHGTAAGIEFLFITGNDFVAARVQVDAQNRFTSPLLRDHTTYTIRPQKTGYTFEPVSAEIALSDADISGVNFIGSTTFRSILGGVFHSLEGAVPNATVHAIRQSDPQFLRAVMTGAGGTFSMQDMPPAPDYVLFAHKPDFLISARTREDQFVSVGNQSVFGVRFDAVRSYMIRGRVTDPAGAGVAGTYLSFYKSGRAYLLMSTDTDGRYESGFAEGIDLLVEPTSEGTYDPPSRQITALGSDQIVDFVRSVQVQVRGTIRNGDGLGIPAVALDLTGGAAQRFHSDLSGRYEFVLAGEGQNYALTPSRPGFTFEPPSVTFVAEATSLSFDFVATPALPLAGRIAFALQITDRSEELAMMNSDSSALVPALQASLPGASDTPGETGGSGPGCPDGFDFFCGVEEVAAGLAGFFPNESRFDENNLQQAPPFNSKTLAISPDGRHVVFATFSGGDVVRPFDSELDELTGILKTVEIATPGSVAQVGDDGSALQVGILIRGKPSWSHNGARVAYSAHNGIFVISPDAGSGTSVDGSDDRDVDPALSPDGTKLAFARLEANGKYNLYMINVSGEVTNLLQLTYEGNNRYPAWSPNGERIAFASDRDGDYDIFFLGNQQFDEFRQTSNSDVDDLHPTWSPDGTLLAFQRTGPGDGVVAGDPGPSFIWVKRVSVPAATLEIPLMAGRRPSWSATPTVQTPPAGQPQTISDGAISITFPAVSGSGGETTMIPRSPVSPSSLPAGYFAISGSLLTYEISTTANFLPPAIVCFTLSDIADNQESDFNALRILHAENGMLLDRTIRSGVHAPNFALRKICASVNSFSPFVLARTADISKPMIHGKVLNPAGKPLPGVTVRLSGSATRTTVTDGEGAYVFPELGVGGNYLVIPLDVNLAFAPSFAPVDNLTNTVLIAFLGHPRPTPALTAAMDEQSPGGVKLSWPAQSPNMVLEYTFTLAAPAWIPVPGKPMLIDASIVVNVPTTGTRFFRLKHQ